MYFKPPEKDFKPLENLVSILCMDDRRNIRNKDYCVFGFGYGKERNYLQTMHLGSRESCRLYCNTKGYHVTTHRNLVFKLGAEKL